jgi:DNA invertase Pin-like site-specific DNA recombinase
MAEHTGKFVAYYRVSTDSQGQRGLGIEAQRQAVATFLNGGDWRLVDSFTEVESGTRSDRPELAKALAACRAHRATLVIAKLDRLSRNAAFLLQLRDAGVDIVCADMPEANRLMIGIMAMIAEHEAEAISARTKAALDVIKTEIAETGRYTTKAGRVITSLGNGGRPISPDSARRLVAAGAEARTAQSHRRAADLMPIIERIRTEGVTSATGIARVLNEEKIPTPRGKVGTWQPVQVQRVLAAASTAAAGAD